MADISPALRALAEKALAAWELDEARLHPIGISENASFRVDTPDKRYVLRIHRPGYHTLAELESEHVWTHALLEAGVDVPVPARTPKGREYVTLGFEGGERHIGMLEWIDGELLHHVIHRKPSDFARHFRAVGGIAAAIHNQSSCWSVPAGFQRHRLDIDGLLGDDAFWGHFWTLPQMSNAQREVIGSARRAIAEELSRLGQGSQVFSLIHADLHTANLVVGEQSLHVIDFDDAGFGWHHYNSLSRYTATTERTGSTTFRQPWSTVIATCVPWRIPLSPCCRCFCSYARSCTSAGAPSGRSTGPICRRTLRKRPGKQGFGWVDKLSA